MRENLEIGCVRGTLDRGMLERVFDYFPRLKERLFQAGRDALLDEPSEGLMPSLVTLVEQTIRRLHREGMAILLVEQNLGTARALAHRLYVMEKGEIRFRTTPEELRASPAMVRAYLGVDAPVDGR